MFDLERTEKYVVLFLASTLLLGLGVTVYVRSRPAPQVKVEHFTVDRSAYQARDLQPAGQDRININEAGAEDLMKLKGVGEVLAARIVDYRSSRGLFVMTDDVKKVEGIGPALFKKIRDDITVD